MLDPKLIEVCKPQFVAAAQWWTNQLAGTPGRDAGFRQSDDPSGMGTALMLMEAATAPATTAEALNKFRDKLAEYFARQVAQTSWVEAITTLGTDYGPDADLGEIAEECGISSRRFPIKTMMWIVPGRTTVRLGYGAAEKTLYPQPFADAFETEFRSKGGTGHVSIYRVDPVNFDVRVGDRNSEAAKGLLAASVLGDDATAAATFHARDLAEIWGRRERITCEYMGVPGRADSRCYDGHYYDASGRHECPACKGVGYTINPLADTPPRG